MWRLSIAAPISNFIFYILYGAYGVHIAVIDLSAHNRIDIGSPYTGKDAQLGRVGEIIHNIPTRPKRDLPLPPLSTNADMTLCPD